MDVRHGGRGPLLPLYLDVMPPGDPVSDVPPGEQAMVHHTHEMDHARAEEQRARGGRR